MTEHERLVNVFQQIHSKQLWGRGESVSGGGSSLVQTARLIRTLPNLFSEFEVRTILDIPCGDWNWMKEVDLSGVDYLGADVVDEIVENNRRYERTGIRFARMNLLDDPLPRVDLILTRDCLVHLTYAEISAAFRNMVSSGSRLLLTTTFPGRSPNRDVPTGRWRPLNLETAPFHLPPPTRYVFEWCTQGQGRYADKSLGLWSIESLAVLK